MIRMVEPTFRPATMAEIPPAWLSTLLVTVREAALELGLGDSVAVIPVIGDNPPGSAFYAPQAWMHDDDLGKVYVWLSAVRAEQIRRVIRHEMFHAADLRLNPGRGADFYASPERQAAADAFAAGEGPAPEVLDVE